MLLNFAPYKLLISDVPEIHKKWLTNKHLLISKSDMKLIEQGKQALAYYFEVLARAEPDKQVIFVLNLQGSGLAQRKTMK